MNIKKNLLNFFNHPLFTIKLINKIVINFLFKEYVKKTSKKFFQNINKLEYFSLGDKKEIEPEYDDLRNLYKLIRKRKPKCVLEFGSGFSTIAISLALKDNWEKDKVMGNLYTVDGNEKWLLNTQNKMKSDLKKFVKFHFSKAFISTHNGQLVTFHEKLPDVVPNFIYLDGPSPHDVEGNIKGLSFNKTSRRIISADTLLYESTAPADFFVLVDRRYSNSNFLEKNFIYEYKINKKIYLGGTVTFEKKYQPYP